jgi:hypothetical protein
MYVYIIHTYTYHGHYPEDAAETDRLEKPVPKYTCQIRSLSRVLLRMSTYAEDAAETDARRPATVEGF